MGIELPNLALDQGDKLRGDHNDMHTYWIINT
jgi:hypothetical protein